MKKNYTESEAVTQKTGLIILAALFLPASFFFQPNMGSLAPTISHNTTVWIAATLLISSAILFVIKAKRINFPTYWLTLSAFPASILLLGFIVDNFIPISWLSRQFYVLAGFLFLISLFQFNFRTRQIETAMLIILCAAVIHALYGISQILWPGISPFIIPNSRNVPYSTFQQINLHATFQATSLLISFYLLSRPRFRNPQPFEIVLLIAAVFFSAFIVAYSGSRIGLISAITGLIIIFGCSWRKYAIQKRMFLITVSVLLLAAALGSKGIEKSSDKISSLATTNELGVATASTSTRINIYRVSFDLFLEAPFTGYGVGSFEKQWIRGKSEYLIHHPEASFPSARMSHPHNELLLWLIEGGMISILGMLITAISILIAAFRCGLNRGLIYLSLPLPLILHTQVELPFYISNIPWLLLMFLLFIPLSGGTRTKQLKLTLPARLFYCGSAIAIFTFVTWLMIDTIRANQSIQNFLASKPKQPELLTTALRNPFFNDMAEHFVMRWALLNDLHAGANTFSPQFIKWAEGYIEYVPSSQLYIDLSRAYLSIEENEKALATIERGIRAYPDLEKLHKSKDLLLYLIDNKISSAVPVAAPIQQQDTPVQ